MSTGFAPPAAKPVGASATSAKRVWTAAAIALAAGLAAGALLALRQNTISQPLYHQVTFRRGTVFGGRFGPDGQTIYFSAAWDGRPAEIFSLALVVRSLRLGHAGTQLLGVSSAAEMILLLNSRTGQFQQFGTLARMPIGGGAPRELLNDVNWAENFSDRKL